MIFVAHAVPSSVADGRHVNTRRRAGLSETPVALNGPTIARLRRCGSVVTP